MAWRDTRASRRRLLLFSASIVLGIAALVALGSLTDSLERSLHAQARNLVGADLVVTGRAPLSAEVERAIAGLGGIEAREVTFSSMMAFSGGGTRLVQVEALGGGFPFYGDFASEPAPTAGELQAGRPGAILEPALLDQFGVKPGGRVKLGRAFFTVTGSLKKIPGDGPFASLFAPRALIPLDSLPATGLLAHQALARYRAALKLPPGVDADALADDWRERFASEHLSFETARSRERDLGRAISNIFDYLSLIGFSALLLGAVGVAAAIQVHVRRKTATVAVLRCLGASACQAFSVYLVQGAALGAVGAVAGGALGALIQAAVPLLFGRLLPVAVDFSLSWHAVARGMAGGWAVCVLFSLIPLLPLRKISPLAALRATVAGGGKTRFDPAYAVVGLLALAAVARFAVGQTRSATLGLGFTAMLALALAALAGSAWLVARLARAWGGRALPYAARQGLANLHRPNNRTTLLIMALGLGTGLVLTLSLARGTLLREIEDTGARGRPNLLLFDIGADQMGPLRRLAEERGAPLAEEAPVVAMRIASLNGRSVADLLADRRSKLAAWALRREYRSTYRDHLSASERVVSGAFVGHADPAAAVPISVEEGLAGDLRLRLGDRIDWDVQGVTLPTQVASIRAVEWRRLEPNFFVVFPAGVLEQAPQFYMAALRAPTPADSARLQSAVVAAFPNVSAIDLTLVRQTLDDIFSKAAFVLRFTSLAALGTGLVVLAGAALAGREQRARETVLLRTLGASRAQLGRIQGVEYAALGFLSAVLGSILALVANELLARRVFHVPAAPASWELLASLVALPLLTFGAGRLADRGLTSLPPLEALRAES